MGKDSGRSGAKRRSRKRKKVTRSRDDYQFVIHRAGYATPKLVLTESDILMIEYALLYHLSLPNVEYSQKKAIPSILWKLRALRKWPEIEDLGHKELTKLQKRFQIDPSRELTFKVCPLCKEDHITPLARDMMRYAVVRQILEALEDADG